MGMFDTLARLVTRNAAAEKAVLSEAGALAKAASALTKEAEPLAVQAKVLLEDAKAPSGWLERIGNRLRGTPDKFISTPEGVIAHIDHSGSLALLSKDAATGRDTAVLLRKGYAYKPEALERAATKDVTWAHEREAIQADIDRGKNWFERQISVEHPTTNRYTQRSIIEDKKRAIIDQLSFEQKAVSPEVKNLLEEFGYIEKAAPAAATAPKAIEAAEAMAVPSEKIAVGKYTERALAEDTSKSLAI